MIILLMLSGCAPALIAGGAAGGYKLATDERDSGQIADDKTITAKINNKMAKDPAVDAYQIDVDTLGGHVILTGVVESEKESRRAAQIALGVPGVKSVRNELQIGQKSFGEMFDDKYIGSKIKAKLIGEPEIRSLNIDVDVNRGIVTLTGYVENHDQKRRAIQIAKKTSGTVKVIDNLKIK
jgi:hyperosmotically inducible protein